MPRKRVELRRQGQLAERQQDAEHQADRDPEREIFGKEIGKHPPHDADGPPCVDDILEQPQHLIEDEQHGGEHQRTEQRNRDLFGEITVDQSDCRNLAVPAP